MRGTTRQLGNEIDEFVTEALRNNLLGLPLDLAAINLARGRDTGIPSLNAARREFYDRTGDSQLKPYTSWADFVQHLKHPGVADQFHRRLRHALELDHQPTTLDGKARRRPWLGSVFGGDGATPATDRLDFLNSTGAWASLPNGVTITGLDDVDLWIGGLAEEKMPFGGMLGSTFNFVFETQLENLQNGDRFYYLAPHRGSQLPHRAGEQLVRQTDHGEHRRDASAGPRLLDAGLILEVDQTRQFTG